MRKKSLLFTLTLIFILSISTSVLFGGLALFADAEDTGITYSYIRTDGPNKANRYTGAVSYNSCIHITGSDTVEFDYDFLDSVTSATLKLTKSQGDIKVEVKAEGGEFTEVQALSKVTEYIDVVYDLTNALTSSDKKITIRLSCSGYTVLLNSVTVSTNVFPALSENVTIAPYTENHSLYLQSFTSNVGYYNYNSGMHTVHIKSGERAVYAFGLVKNTKTVNADINSVGGAAKLLYSTNGTDYFDVEDSGEIDVSEASVLYIAVETATQNETFLIDLSVTPTIDNLDEGGDGGGDGDSDESNIPVDITNAYIDTNSLDSLTRYTGNASTGLQMYQGYVHIKNGNQNSVEFDFDLDDGATFAIIKFSVAQGDYMVEVKADGTSDFTEVTTTAPQRAFIATPYLLTEDNALSASNNKFTVRRSPKTSTVLLGSVGLSTNLVPKVRLNELKEGVTITPATESEMKYLYSETSGILCYLHNSTYNTIQLESGERAVFAFVLEGGVKTLSASANGANSSPFKLTWSVEGETFFDFSSIGTMTVDGASIVYIAVEAESSATAFLVNLSVTGSDEEPVTNPATGENANVNVPERANNYFAVGSAEEKLYMFGTEQDFETTHSGLVKDGHQGGSGIEVANARKFTSGGQYLAYDFDLPSGVTSARLVLRAGKGLAVSVSKDLGETYTQLSTEMTPTERGYYLFELTTNDALDGVENKFRLVILAGGENYVFAIGVYTDNYEVKEGVLLTPDTEAGIRYIVDTKNVKTYYINAKYSTYFINSDAYVIFKFVLPDTVSNVKAGITVTACGGGEYLAVSADGNFESASNLFTQGQGGSATPYARTIKIMDIDSVKDSKTLYIKIAAANGDAFFSNVFLSFNNANITKTDEKIAVNSADEAAILYGGVDTMTEAYQNQTGFGDGVPYRKLGQNGYVIYRVVFDTDKKGFQFILNNVDGSYDISVASRMSDEYFYSAMTCSGAGEKSFVDYGVIEKSIDGVVYVKITNTGANDLIWSDFMLKVDNIPEGSDDDKPDYDNRFDYDEEQPAPDANDKPTLPDVPDEPNPEPVKSEGCSSSIVSSIPVIAMLITCTALLLIRRRVK